MESKKIQLKEAHGQFINHLKEKGKAEATVLAYGKDIDQLISFLETLKKLHIHEVTSEDLQAFLAKLSKSNYTSKSISRKLNSTKTFYRFLKINEYVTDDPSGVISHPQFESKPPRILSKLEYRALRDAARDDFRTSAIIEILLQTGVRISELSNIRTEDISQNEVRIRTQNGHPSRDIPLNKAALTALGKYLALRPNSSDNHLFLTKTGKPLLVRNIRSAIDRYFLMAEIKNASVNSLRHTFIAHHLLSGTSVILVSKLVGHKRLSTTVKYQDLIKSQKTEGNFKLEDL